MTQRGRLYGCPVEFALDALGGKWKTVIIARIKQGPLRYSDLRRLIPSLSDKMLTQRLADLVEIGFVVLETSADGKQRYTLTPRGHDLAGADAFNPSISRTGHPFACRRAAHQNS